MMAFERSQDERVRAAVFDWLSKQVDVHGDVLPRTLLAEGTIVDGNRVPLLGPQGIFKPNILDVPVSLTTSPNGPYQDGFSSVGQLLYKYRGTDPNHRDNVGVRFAMAARIPLVYFHGLLPGRYLATWPVFVVADDPGSFTFTVQVDDKAHMRIGSNDSTIEESNDDVRRRYITAETRLRVHQRAFRERVLRAYQSACAFCRFRHRELLDAAHIVPDTDPLGEPFVANGLALCRLHHAAFDRHFLGISPDLIIQVRRDLLVETDGPTLMHGIQALHGQRVSVPRQIEQRPDRERIEIRYVHFLGQTN